MLAAFLTTSRAASAQNDVILTVREESLRAGTVILTVHSVTTLRPLKDPSLTLRMTHGRGGGLEGGDLPKSVVRHAR